MAGKKKKEQESVTEKISQSLELPKDVLCDLSKIEIIGERDVMVENFRGIIEYETTIIRINTKSSVISIMGTNLEISAISKEWISVHGIIESIRFDK